MGFSEPINSTSKRFKIKKCIVKTCIFAKYGKCVIGRDKISGKIGCVWLAKGIPKDMELLYESD